METDREKKIKQLGRCLPRGMLLEKVLEKLEKGPFPELTYVGKGYTKADLIEDLRAVQKGMNWV